MEIYISFKDTKGIFTYMVRISILWITIFKKLLISKQLSYLLTVLLQLRITFEKAFYYKNNVL